MNPKPLEASCDHCHQQGKERELEENTPGTDDEVALTSFFQAVSAQARRHDAQTESDRAACEGIAAATEEQS